MDAFSELLENLLLTPSRNQKLALLVAFFSDQADPDRGWAVAALTDSLEFKSVKAGLIRKMVEQRVDPVLFRLSYDYVGDLAETVSLIWPDADRLQRIPAIAEIIDDLGGPDQAQVEIQLALWLDGLNPRQRWALIKLIGGGMRVGVSARLVKQALATFGSVDINDIEAIWHGLDAPYEALFAWLDGRADRPVSCRPALFRPVMLAHPLLVKSQRDDVESFDRNMVNGQTFAAEWKYDGIRIQAVSDAGVTRLYTRTGDDISHAFPDVLVGLADNVVIDGELLIRQPDGGVAPFNHLQKRLNRKRVSKKLLAAYPAFIMAYDLLVDGAEDVRADSFRSRRARLEQTIERFNKDLFSLSPLLPCVDFDKLDVARREPPSSEIEGVMLKRWDSPYTAGRPRGAWFKWKRDPYLIDAVLIYAQRGHGRRSSFYSDFTFAVWREVDGVEQLTPVGKAYFGFSDADMKRIDKFVRAHTIDRFGPVRAVQADKSTGLVFEIAFEGLQRSTRHKSGVAMRFPRINRIRWDKPASEADRLHVLERMLP